jgi:hypothetical protein
MKRKTFIVTASVAAVGLPLAYYIKKQITQIDPLNTPYLLSRFCNEKELKDMGNAYRKLVPEENDRQKLNNLILLSTNGTILNSTDKIAIAELIDKKIHDEFVGNNTIVVNGWVVSKTEARQCALFSLSKQ